MLDQIKSMLMQKVAGELSERFGLSESMIQTVVNQVMEIAAGMLTNNSSQSGGIAGLMSMGQQLLGGSSNEMLGSIVNALKSQLPSKLTETGQFDNDTASKIADSVIPQVKDLISNLTGEDNNGGDGIIGKLGGLIG